MAKALKVGAMVVGAAALAIVTAGAGTALLAGVSLSAGIGAVSGAIGISVGTLALAASGLSVGASLLQKQPQVPASQTDRLTANVDLRAFRKTVLGSTAMATDVRYVEWFGKDQERCGWIVAHASHACESVDEIWLNDELAWTAASGTQGKFRDYFWVRRVVLEGSAANAFSFGSGKWNGSRRLTGCCYSFWEFKVTGNSKKAESPFASGIPNRVTVIGKGAKLYDPRRDSTVPGGAGPMRAGDQSTWRYVADDGAAIGENLSLQILRVLLGWRINGKLATGSGLPAKRIGLPSFAVAANQCDEPVNRSAGGTEPRFRGAGVLSEGDDPRTVLDMLTAACCGRFRDAGGKLSLAIMHNDLAAAATDDGLNEDDVVGAFTWDPDPSLEQTPNIVRGKYTDPSPGSLYQLVPFPDVSLPSFDGIDRVLQLDLAAVESPSQAQRVCKQLLQRRQYQRRFAAPFDMRAWKYNVGDVVPFTFAPLGFSRKLFRVVETDPGTNPCQMVLEEENPAIYAWDRDDSAPVRAAEPVIYDSRNNPLVLAIDEAATTALWDRITGELKAADNATVGAPAGTPVGDRLAEEVNRLADLNGQNILGEILRGDALAAFAGARTTLDDKPIGTVFAEHRSAQEEANRVFVSNFTALGAKNAAGTGWIFDADTIEITGRDFTARSLSALTADVDGYSADITDLQEILIDPTGATARWVMVSEAEGNIGGLVNTVTKERSDLVVYAQTFKIVNPNGGQPFSPFQTLDDGTVVMGNVEVQKIKIGAVTADSIALNGVTKRYFWLAASLGGTGAAVPDGWGDFGLTNNKAKITARNVPAGGEVSIRIYINAARTGGDNDRVNFRLFRYSAAENLISYLETIAVGLSSAPAVICYEWTDLGIGVAGDYQYVLQADRIDGAGAYYSAKMIVEVGKR